MSDLNIKTYCYYNKVQSQISDSMNKIPKHYFWNYI